MYVYKVELNNSNKTLEQYLNSRAQDGWKLIQCTLLTKRGPLRYECIFEKQSK